MAYPTTASQTELQAINEILAAVGQAPVTSIDVDENDLPTNPDVAMARETLQQVSREVQSEGWSFNRELDYPMQPEEDGCIYIAENMLQIDLSTDYTQNLGKDSVRREGKLYDKLNHTYQWGDGIVYCDIMWLFAWEDLPKPIQQYIVNKAAAVFAQRVVGDANLYQLLTSRALECRTHALEYETQQGDYTFFGAPRGGNYYNSYQPFHALYR